MSAFKRITPAQCKTIIDQGLASIVDVRDSASYVQGHIPGAQLLDNRTVEEFIANTQVDTPIIVYCYHGNSSQGAADYLTEQSFSEVYSMDGGFELWRQQYPALIATD